jgi:hypothetical protein
VLERPQETSNRFFRERDWLAYIAVQDYPPEHWNEAHISNNFRGFCKLLEIDPACLTGYDYSPLRLLVTVHHRLDIPSELWVEADGSPLGGSVMQIMPIRVWPRINQLDDEGGLIPFFGPPPPPPHRTPLAFSLPASPGHRSPPPPPTSRPLLTTLPSWLRRRTHCHHQLLLTFSTSPLCSRAPKTPLLQLPLLRLRLHARPHHQLPLLLQPNASLSLRFSNSPTAGGPPGTRLVAMVYHSVRAHVLQLWTRGNMSRWQTRQHSAQL